MYLASPGGVESRLPVTRFPGTSPGLAWVFSARSGIDAANAFDNVEETVSPARRAEWRATRSSAKLGGNEPEPLPVMPSVAITSGYLDRGFGRQCTGQGGRRHSHLAPFGLSRGSPSHQRSHPNHGQLRATTCTEIVSRKHIRAHRNAQGARFDQSSTSRSHTVLSATVINMGSRATRR